jgi:hypothetical protein
VSRLTLTFWAAGSHADTAYRLPVAKTAIFGLKRRVLEPGTRVRVKRRLGVIIYVYRAYQLEPMYLVQFDSGVMRAVYLSEVRVVKDNQARAET